VSGAHPSPRDGFKQEYEQLQLRYLKKGIEAVEEFLRERSSAQLDEFIRANELPIPTKASKEAIREALVSILAQGRAIRGDK
jgi:predicted dinucleotide-utilizing enzyme